MDADKPPPWVQASKGPAPALTFRQAAETKIWFGKYKGQTLDEIATDDEGLRYLDWARGEFNNQALLVALGVYLNDATISRELDRILKR